MYIILIVKGHVHLECLQLKTLPKWYYPNYWKLDKFKRKTKSVNTCTCVYLNFNYNLSTVHMIQ